MSFQKQCEKRARFLIRHGNADGWTQFHAEMARLGIPITLRLMLFKCLELQGKNLSGVKFVDCQFIGTDLSRLDCTDTIWTRCIFHKVVANRTIFSGGKMSHCTVRWSVFNGATLDNFRLIHSRVLHCHGAHVQVIQTLVSHCDISNVYFSTADEDKPLIWSINNRIQHLRRIE